MLYKVSKFLSLNNTKRILIFAEGSSCLRFGLRTMEYSRGTGAIVKRTSQA